MRWILMAVMMPCAAFAEDWTWLTGPEITTALTGRVVLYDGDHRQEFMADGRTLYDDRWGYWRVEGDRYCSQWPPSDRWTCYDVAQNGLEVRFQADDGSTVTGRYADVP
ncbi:MAG: hypothetical protein RLZZ437_1475 [Pseudomonadota bacterium]|jgi:hypothetical protein